MRCSFFFLSPSPKGFVLYMIVPFLFSILAMLCGIVKCIVCDFSILDSGSIDA